MQVTTTALRRAHHRWNHVKNRLVQYQKKKTTKKLQFQEELSERILHLAEKEDDQVDLELSAIRQHMKHKLNDDEIDDLLDEIKDCTRKFFDNKC